MQRKVFRIEQTLAGRMATVAPAAASQRQPAAHLAERHDDADAVQTLRRELSLVHDIIARNTSELAALIGDGKERRLARAADELRASVDGMDYGTQKILKSVEVIDDSARALTATLKDDYKRGLAQDIQDHVVQIYEACNFQDIAGQRIGNVIATLTMVEDQVAAMLDRCDAIGGRHEAPVQAKPCASRGLLNGPKLDGDHGHASQRHIDAMFGNPA